MSITAALFIGMRRLEQDKMELDFRQRAQARVVALQRQLEDNIALLKVVNQTFATFGTVSREQFRVFTRPLLENHPYVQALNFHRIVSGGERDAYEREMGKRYPGFALRQLIGGKPVPAARQARYMVVDYLEPMADNEAALGLDVSPNRELARASARATDSRQAISTGLLQLAQRGGTLRGLLVVMPVYRQGAPLGDVETRRRAVIGDTAIVFDVEDMVHRMLKANNLLGRPGMATRIYVDDKADEKRLVFRDGDESSGTSEPSAASGLVELLLAGRPRSLAQTFDMAGQPWHAVVSAQTAAYPQGHAGSLAALAAGVLLTLAAAAYLHAAASRSRRVQRLVESRTAQLRRTNELLVEDIAARKRAEEGLQLRQRAIEASANAVIIAGAGSQDYPIEYVNPAFERITGYALSEVIGRSCRLLWNDREEQGDIGEILDALHERREAHATLPGYTRSGAMFWADVHLAPVRDESDEVSHFVFALHDVTATRHYQAELEFQASRDTLTGLANRHLLIDRLAQAVAFAERYGHPAWVLFLNLDRFKFVNDTLGHRAGDRLLRTVAVRLQQAVRETDTIARLSADEFVLVLSERADDSLSSIAVQRIMEAIAQPITIEGHTFVMGSSVGIAVCPSDGRDPESLIKHAGIAMVRAKETGRNNFQFYTAAMNEKALERLHIEGDLRSALEREEFVLHYQPQVDLRSGRIVGVEALLRWRHPALGMVPPVRFIQLAEETGLIVPLGAWVMHSACRQSMAWQRAGLEPVRIAVNLSARQFYQHELAAAIAEILDETGLAPQLLELELTESMMMHDVEHAARQLRELKALGVQLAVDDFGTGYSSLAYLKRFPIDLLKIDQSFVRDISVDPDDAAIVTSVISLAHSLRLQVIAEGVETQAQLDYLQRHGCDCMQGYYFSPPLPAEECETLLRERNPS